MVEEVSVLGVVLIYYFIDYVFDGCKVGLYFEIDLMDLQSVYGKIKLVGEQVIVVVIDKFWIWWISWVYGVYGGNFFKIMLCFVSECISLCVVVDQFGVLIFVCVIVEVICDVLMVGGNVGMFVCVVDMVGIYYFVGGGWINWYGYV